MKKYAVLFCLAFLILICSSSAEAQTASRPPDPSVVRNQEAERDAMHNLQAARLYFRLRRAYVASSQRCEEIIAAYPNFSRIDEVLYIAGTSYLRLAENRGRQRSTTPPDRLRNEGRMYLSRLIAEFPESDFRRRAEEELRAVGGAIRQENNRQ